MVEMFKTNRGFRIAAILVIAQVILMTLLAALRVGSENYVKHLLEISAPVYAALATLASLWGWKISNPKEISRRIWGWMSAGLFLWVIAGLLWSLYSAQSGTAALSGSPADFFRLSGYVPVFIALILRVGASHVGLKRGQIRQLLLITGLFFSMNFLGIFLPILLNHAPARGNEALVNSLSALCDLGLLGIATWIILALKPGRYSIVWLLVASAMIMRSLADFIFTYTSLLTALPGVVSFYSLNITADILLVSSYLILALGMLAHHQFLADSHQEDDTTPLRPDITFSTALIFTNSDNHVIGASYNFTELIGAISMKELKHRPLSELLGIEAGMVDAMMQLGRQNGYINEYPLEIQTAGQRRTRGWITATSDRWSEKYFNGLNIALRLRAGEPVLAELDSESSAIAQRILTDTGQLSQEKITMLKDYFKTLVLGLYVLVDNLAGKAVTVNMLDNFNELAALNHWHIQFDQQRFQIPEDFLEDQLAYAFRHLLKNIKDYSVEVLNTQVIADEIKKIERQLSPKVVQTATDFGLRNQ